MPNLTARSASRLFLGIATVAAGLASIATSVTMVESAPAVSTMRLQLRAPQQPPLAITAVMPAYDDEATTLPSGVVVPPPAFALLMHQLAPRSVNFTV